MGGGLLVLVLTLNVRRWPLGGEEVGVWRAVVPILVDSGGVSEARGCGHAIVSCLGRLLR